MERVNRYAYASDESPAGSERGSHKTQLLFHLPKNKRRRPQCWVVVGAGGVRTAVYTNFLVCLLLLRSVLARRVSTHKTPPQCTTWRCRARASAQVKSQTPPRVFPNVHIHCIFVCIYMCPRPSRRRRRRRGVGRRRRRAHATIVLMSPHLTNLQKRRGDMWLPTRPEKLRDCDYAVLYLILLFIF
jgi:hypothetical protein